MAEVEIAILDEEDGLSCEVGNLISVGRIILSVASVVFILDDLNCNLCRFVLFMTIRMVMSVPRFDAPRLLLLYIGVYQFVLGWWGAIMMNRTHCTSAGLMVVANIHIVITFILGLFFIFWGFHQ